MRKVFLFGGLALTLALVLVAASVTYVLFDIDEVIRGTVQTSASKAYKVEVSVAHATMSLKGGDGAITDIRIANPPGFAAVQAIHIPTITLQVDTARPAGSAITIARAVINQPRITLDIVGGEANLVRLRDSARAWATRSTNPDQEASKGQRLIIDEAILQGGTLVLHADFLGGEEIEVAMPDTRIKEIGVSTNGALPAEIIAALTEGLLTGAERAARRIDLKARAEQKNLRAPDIDLSAILKK